MEAFSFLRKVDIFQPITRRPIQDMIMSFLYVAFLNISDIEIGFSSRSVEKVHLCLTPCQKLQATPAVYTLGVLSTTKKDQIPDDGSKIGLWGVSFLQMIVVTVSSMTFCWRFSRGNFKTYVIECRCFMKLSYKKFLSRFVRWYSRAAI